MTLDAFRASLSGTEPPAGPSLALRALWLDAKGDWNGAHEAAQQDDGPAGDWVHAYLHRKQGDAGNAAYWYRRAGKPVSRDSLAAEWDAIAAALAAGLAPGFAGDREMSEPSQPPQPVTRVAARRARPQCDEAYAALLRGMFAEMRGFPGFVGADLIPPPAAGGEFQVVTRFAREADLARWDASDAHKAWLSRLDAVAEGAPAYRVFTGLEAWFAPTVLPAGKQPPRGKMTFATWLGIFPTASLLIYFVSPWLAPLPFLLRTAILTGLIALTMSYVVMPRLSRWLRPWLVK